MLIAVRSDHALRHAVNQVEAGQPQGEMYGPLQESREQLAPLDRGRLPILSEWPLRPVRFQTVIPRNVRLGEAPSHGLPAILYDVKSRGSEAYLALAREVLAREAVPQTEHNHG